MKNYAITITVFLFAIILFLAGVNSMSKTASTEGAATLEKALYRACVQCYAIEGRYPPSVDYLEANYGIQLDRGKYIVDYDGFATNIMPDISVIKRESDGEVK